MPCSMPRNHYERLLAKTKWEIYRELTLAGFNFTHACRFYWSEYQRLDAIMRTAHNTSENNPDTKPQI